METVFRFLVSLLLVFGLFRAPFALGEEGKIENPFSNIRVKKAPNGLTLVFAPSAAAKTFKIKINVKAGWLIEDKKSAGISHLLEHYLFTDARLRDDMTYLEVIREKGGSANGWTWVRETVYHATIPSQHAKWLTETFAKMIFGRKFDDATTDHTKKPVLLEIGEPPPMAALWNLGLYDLIYPDFLGVPDFWESEFGIQEKTQPRFREQLNTYRFHAEDLKKHYLEYYHPSNMVIYFAGKFDPKEIEPLALELFGQEPPRFGKTIPDPVPRPRGLPYIRTNSTSGIPYLAVGTKVWNLTQEDAMALNIYLGYAAHRLQKELRNKQGKTYSVRPVTVFNKDFGYGGLSLEVPADDYSKIAAQVRSLLERETREKNLTRKQFYEARKLYSTRFTLTDRDASTFLYLAEWLQGTRENYHATQTPFAAFNQMTYEDWVGRLQRLFAPNHLFLERTEPTLLFRLEKPVLILLFLAFFFYSARFLASRSFAHSHVRMVRKLTYPPLFLGEFGLVLLGVALSRFLIFLVDRAFLAVPLLQSSFLISSYLNTLIDFGLAAGTCLFFLVSVVRKVIVCSDALYLKRISYASERVGWHEIEGVKLVSPWKVLSSWSLLRAIFPRFYYFDPFFWRPGLLLSLQNGRSYYLGVRNAQDAVRDIRGFISSLDRRTGDRRSRDRRAGAKVIPLRRAA